jgi:hypothetical protein
MLVGSFDVPRDIPLVSVRTTKNRGFTPEEIAARCADKIVAVAETAPAAIRDQARAYKKNVEAVVAHYLKEAVASDRTTVYNALVDAGHPELVELIRRL